MFERILVSGAVLFLLEFIATFHGPKREKLAWDNAKTVWNAEQLHGL